MSTRILVFNHSANHLLLYKTILGTRGYEVFTYQHDMNSFREVETVQPALIILGNVTGQDEHELDIIDRIRSNTQTQNVPVLIVTTAFTHVLKSEKLRTFGNIHTLAKPFDAVALLDAVELALQSPHSEDVASH